MPRARTTAVYVRPMFELIRTAKELHAKIEQYGKKTEQLQVTLGLTLKEAKERKPGGITWPAFVKKHFNFSRSRADELIQIGTGSTTVEQVNSRAAESMRKTRRNVSADTISVPFTRLPNQPAETRSVPVKITYSNPITVKPVYVERTTEPDEAAVPVEAQAREAATAFASLTGKQVAKNMLEISETDGPAIIADIGLAKLRRIISTLQAIYDAHCKDSSTKSAADRAADRAEAKAKARLKAQSVWHFRG
jgi:hypothetical protein